MNKQVRPGEQTDTLRRHTGEVRWHKMNSGGHMDGVGWADR